MQAVCSQSDFLLGKTCLHGRDVFPKSHELGIPRKGMPVLDLGTSVQRL